MAHSTIKYLACKIEALNHRYIPFSFRAHYPSWPEKRMYIVHYVGMHEFGSLLILPDLGYRWNSSRFCVCTSDFQGRLRKGSQLGGAGFDTCSSRRLSNMTVAAERSSMNGPQNSTRPFGTRYPSTDFSCYFHLILFSPQWGCLLMLIDWWANRWATQEGGWASCLVQNEGHDRWTRERYAGPSLLASVLLSWHLSRLLRYIHSILFHDKLLL